MRTELYLLCLFPFFTTVFLTVYTQNPPLSIGVWIIGFIMGGIVRLLLEKHYDK